MAWQFSNSVGYRGYAKIGKATLLATGGNINITQDPLTSQGIWGATPEAAAQVVAWAYNYLRVEGSISYDLTKGPVYEVLREWAFLQRDTAKEILMKPDGGNGYAGEGYCSGASFGCSEGQIVTGDVNFVGDAGGDAGGIIAGGEGNAGADGSQYGDIFGANTGTVAGEGALIAYWATSVNGVDDAISWNVSYNSDIQLLKCCTGDNKAPIGADYVLLGDMSGDGSYTVFTLKGDFDVEGFHTVKTAFNIKVGDAGTIKIPYAIISSGSTSVQTGSSYITADFNFTAVGDGTNGPVSLE